MKAISICMPLTGGLYTAFLNLRRALRPHGVDLTWLLAGRSLGRRAREEATAEDLACGAIVAPDTDDELAKARALLDHFESEQPDLAIVHVLGGPMETNLIRYLPSRVRRVLIVHSISVGTYRAARSIRDHVHATVGVSPRIESDLVRHYSFPAEWTCSIPNAVDVQGGWGAARPGAMESQLRVLSLGRVEHASKGILWLPEILRRAVRAGADLSVTVAGGGPDLGALKDKIREARLDGRVHYLGPVSRERIPGIMASHDVLLFPSIYEGFGITLVEAMAAGCVPVASRIRGVTDTIVKEQESGLLFPVGNRTRAADHLVALWRNRDLLGMMSNACRSAAARFDLPHHGDSYAALLQRVARAPRELASPLPFSEWRMSPYLQAGWRRWVPASVKGCFRLVRERA